MPLADETLSVADVEGDDLKRRRIAAARRRVTWIPVAGCLLLALLGIYPGSVFTSACVMPLFLATAGLWGALVWLRALSFSRTPAPVAVFWTLAVLGTGYAANAYVVARIAFIPFRPAFETRANQIEAGPPHTRAGPLWIGIYPVDEAYEDERGGVYFRITEGARMIDTVYCGFAWKPNAAGSPFGNAHYRLTRIAPDWFIFWANNDW